MVRDAVYRHRRRHRPRHRAPGVRRLGMGQPGAVARAGRTVHAPALSLRSCRVPHALVRTCTMRNATRIFLLAIGLAASLGAAAGHAGSLVEFPSLSEQGPARLLGYLARPDAGLSGMLGSHSNRAGPYPAVVVLHGCGGISSHSAQIADRLDSWGYVALTVDSLGPRGIVGQCGGALFEDQAIDAYAALRYLSQLDFVDPARVAVLGQSMGGSAVLYAVDRALVAQYFNQRFSAAIAYYPGYGCGFPAASMTAPTLILIGEADDWTLAEPCRETVARARPDGAPITL